MKSSLLLLAGMLVAPVVSAQAPTSGDGHGPAFEVASVKPNKSGDVQALMFPQPGGRFTATNVTLRSLIIGAYQLQDSQLSGGPDWLDRDRFDIAAKAGGDPSPDQFVAMLQTLLSDRFKVALHHEARVVPIYALLLARRDGRLGPRLRPSDAKCGAAASTYFPVVPDPSAPPPCGDFRMGPGSLVARGMTMARLAGLLAPRVGRVVVDATALSEAFDIELDWTPDQLQQTDNPQPNDAPSLFTALQEELGLKLESTRGPVDVLVIDRAERPTED
jgi:uncharacterized protein (TIGR03435 family)